MNRSKLQTYIEENYNTVGECLFARYPDFRVFRHSANRKWFAVIMPLSERKLGLPGDAELTVVNVKCDPRMIGSFRQEPGIYPGYHMNKVHWLSVALDGRVEADKIKFLLDMSFELTKGGRH